MAGYVPPQLHALVGADLDAVTEDHLRNLVGAPETEWFDAKREPYGSSDSQKRDLASDVAAFANRRGGLIVIGLDEQTAGTATALAPQSDAVLAGEELRITQIVSSLVAPVPVFRPVRVAGANGSYVLVSIPPSVRRPHCVAVSADSVRYPLREGTHKRYLAESEIADLYRSRFADARAQTDLAEQRHGAIVESLDRSTQAWLVVSMQPDRPGDFSLTRDGIEPLRNFGSTERVSFPTWFRGTTYTPSPAFRGVTLYDHHDKVYSSTARLHLDGGGSLAYGWDRQLGNAGDDGPKVACVADEDILGALVNGIWSLAHWAMDWAGTSGDATLLAQLYPPSDFPMTLWQYRTHFPDRLDGARDLAADSGLVETTATLDGLRQSGLDLLLTARRVTADIESAFGVLGPPQVSVSGAVRWKYFYGEKVEWLRRWADAWGIEVSDDTNSE